MNNNFYDKTYFMDGTKSNYGRGRFSPYVRKAWYPHAQAYAEQFHNLFGANCKKVMVYGCARGYLVEALNKVGFQTVGVDISEWAIKHASKNARKYVAVGDITKPSLWQDNQFDLLVAQDVLEHIPEEQIPQMLNELTRITGKFAFVEVIVEDKEHTDPSHVSANFPTETWIEWFQMRGWLLLDYNTVLQEDKLRKASLLFKKLKKLKKPEGKGAIEYKRIRDPSDAQVMKWYGRLDTPVEDPNNPVIKDKKVLVLIPVYNNAKLLPVWFNFLYKLNPQPTEYVFCENNSTDESLELIMQFRRPHKLIRIWVKDKPISKGDSHYSVIAHVRQLLLTYARNSDCDYAIFLDTDIFINTPWLIESLVSWNQDLVGGKYMRFFPSGLHIASYWFTGNPEKPFRLRRATSLPFEEVAVTSAGCLCLSRRLIQNRNINFYPIEAPVGTSEDFGFCHSARQHGFKVYLDSLLDLRHMSSSDRENKMWSVAPSGEFLPFSYSHGESQDIKQDVKQQKKE